MLYKRIHIITDGKAFEIIVEVIYFLSGQNNIQKCAPLNWSALPKIRNRFSERNFIVCDCVIYREDTHI